MSQKRADKKLGRNPFDHKKPSRARQETPADAPAPKTVSPEPVSHPESLQTDTQTGNPSGILFPANPAWFLVDLWAGALTEPYFFWARSMDLVKRTFESKVQEF